MPYVTKYRDVTRTGNLGYDVIPLHRPKFIYFEFTGLRPGIPHWIFFGGVEVTKFCNTSYTRANYENASRTSVLKSPGEKFITASQFPTDSGLAYSGPTALGGSSAPLYATSNGILSGVFYLQSNTSYAWEINASGRELLVTDVSNADKESALSYGAALFKGFGQYENYYEYVEQESYQQWQDPPRSNDDGGGSKWQVNSNGTVTHGSNSNYTGQSGSVSGGFSSFHDAVVAKGQANRNPSDPPGTIRIGSWSWSPFG